MRDFRDHVHAGLTALWAADEAELEARAGDMIAPGAVWDIAAPVNELSGRAAILDGFLRPLRAAMPHVRRRDEIFIGGRNVRDAGGDWVAAVTHYVGNFAAPLWGIPPSGGLVFLRAGEFYRVEDGRLAQARIIVDLPDLMRQAGRAPFDMQLGTEMLFPGPATHDGVLPQGAHGGRSLDLVQRMLSDLHAFDPETHASAGQTGEDGTWADDMLWYGPGGIGSNYRWEGFVAFHRAAFLRAFPDRAGGNHFCRIGDGDYAAVSGWPSMTMTHAGPYLGMPATGKSLSLRVMDFYRCDYRHDPRGRIAENWVLLDYVDMFAQMGVDLIARGSALAGAEPPA